MKIDLFHWRNLKKDIQIQCNDVIKGAWIEDLNFVSFKDEKKELFLEAPSSLHKSYIEKNALEQIKKVISSSCKDPISIHINISEDTSKISSTCQNKKNLTLKKEKKPPINPFNSDYTFSNSICSHFNELAYVSCYRVTQNLGAKNYNPLFIHGPVGMGKTHLLQAVGNELFRQYPDLNIRYLSAEMFMNEVISSIVDKKMESFRKRFRNNTDVLLLDDIQYLTGNYAPQEFFNTFNYLKERNRQIVVASDCIPRDIPQIDDRIKSRLEWGIIADIQIPKIEERLAIIKHKIRRIGIDLEENSINYLAKISKRSIREIEGNLRKIKFYSELKNKKPTLEMIKSRMKFRENTFTLNIETLQDKVAKYFNISLTDLKSKSRYQSKVLPRQVAMYLIKKHLNKVVLKDIGKAFGGRDHATVINSIKRIEKLRNENSQIQSCLTHLDAEIQNLS